MYIIECSAPSAWIGLEDIAEEGTWVWQSTNVAASTDEVFWLPNQPNDYHHHEDCAKVVDGDATTGDGWNDGDCEEEENATICEMR